MEVALAISGVILTSLIIIAARWIIHRRAVHQSLKKYGLSGPKPDLLSGNMYQLTKEPTTNNIMDNWLKEYGDVFGYFMGEDIYVVIKDLEMLKKIYIQEFSTFPNKQKFLLQTEPFPKMLPGLRGKRWKEVRGIITPAFTTGKIKRLTDIISRKTELMMTLLMRKVNNHEIFDIHALVQGLTMDVIATCALAINKNIQEDPNDEILLAMRNIVIHRLNPVEEIGLLFPFLSKFLHFFADLFTYKKSLNIVSDYLRAVMRERRRNPNLRSADIFQSLMDSCDASSEGNETKLTEEEAIANALVVLLAGYNTSSSTLAFIFYLLTMNPDIQDRLYQEIRQARDASYSTLQSLTYMNQVCSEALRLYPTVTDFISRECNSEYILGQYTIPKGATVYPPIWSIHHDPDIWPDPYKFDPDRFSPANKEFIHVMSYFPFGVGPRKCVGMRFAQLEMKMALYKVLLKVKLERCEKTEDPLSLVCHAFTLFPTNGVWVKATPRGGD